MKLDYTKLHAVWSRFLIDGDLVTDKTTLAREISKTTGAKHISFDDYLRGNRENCLQQVNYEKLQQNILESTGKIIMDGVCALAVVAKIGIRYKRARLAPTQHATASIKIIVTASNHLC